MSATVIDKQIAIELLSNLQEKIAEIFGFYFDCKRALPAMSKADEKSQHVVLEQLAFDPTARGNIPKTISDLDQLPFTYGKGDPNDRRSVALHSVTQKELKRRNMLGGKNHSTLSNSVVVLLYSLWNDEFRPKIARSIGIKLNELSSDIFGDLRLIRNSIIHHSGIALPEVGKCKVLKYFNPGDNIVFSDDDMDELLFGLLKDIDRMAAHWVGEVTMFGVRRNVMGESI